MVIVDSTTADNAAATDCGDLSGGECAGGDCDCNCDCSMD